MYYLQLYFNPFVILYRASHGSEERKVFEVVQTLDTKYRGVGHDQESTGYERTKKWSQVRTKETRMGAVAHEPTPTMVSSS